MLLDRYQVEYCLQLLTQLEEAEECGNFLEPVDYKALGLLDYPMVIKRPMDLSTCRRKLNTGRYHSFDRFKEDLNQIWENCRIYNQAGSDIVAQADAMEEHQKKFLREHPLPTNIPLKRIRTEENEEFNFEQKVIFAEKIRKCSTEALVKIFNLVENGNKNAVERIGEHLRLKIDKLEKGVLESVNK